MTSEMLNHIRLFGVSVPFLYLCSLLADLYVNMYVDVCYSCQLLQHQDQILTPLLFGLAVGRRYKMIIKVK